MSALKFSPALSWFGYIFFAWKLVNFEAVEEFISEPVTQAEYKSSSINPLFPEVSDCATKTLSVVV